MMEEYLAHSGKNGYPAQTYVMHVKGTQKKALAMAKEIASYYVKDAGEIENILKLAAAYHDLGKLNEENQKVLHQEGKKKGRLPVNHVDAGAAFLKQKGEDAICSLILVYGHHHGLPDFSVEKERSEESYFRDGNRLTRSETDRELEQLLRLHRKLFPDKHSHVTENCKGDPSVFLRMLFSCLVDADHSDTAEAYGQIPKCEKAPELLPELRLKALDRYVNTLQNGEMNRRNELRREMYETCKNCNIKSEIVSHDGPVGSGKTTAVMAYQLRQASLRKARRIFVILPYNNIITQSVKVYRKALALPGENPEAVVAELHCKADFESEDTRYLNALWKAPIIVTTAVAFFETLSSNRPGALRRLHELPGSIIFVDEAHAALPVKLLPLAWKWMKILAEEWNCCWILASGSLVRFWNISELIGSETKQIPEILPQKLRNDLMEYEKRRIRFCWNPISQSREGFVEWVMGMKGPRLIIMNTVQSAAAIADNICKKYGRACVEHLSTALLPEDRADTIEKVQNRLTNKSDTDWVLVATSCVEAGVDFSFHVGFREMTSLLSLLQTAGRVNRNGSNEEAEVWSFRLQENESLAVNNEIGLSASILEEYFRDGKEITPEMSTVSIIDELKQGSSLNKEICKLLDAEVCWDFKTVNDEFRVIESDTVPVVIKESVATQIKQGYGSWQDIQKSSVSIYRDQLKKWQVRQIAEDVYQWTLPYDSFLGYMAGVLKREEVKKGLLSY